MATKPRIPRKTKKKVKLSRDTWMGRPQGTLLKIDIQYWFDWHKRL